MLLQLRGWCRRLRTSIEEDPKKMKWREPEHPPITTWHAQALVMRWEYLEANTYAPNERLPLGLNLGVPADQYNTGTHRRDQVA
jgi:hypothetical protein